MPKNPHEVTAEQVKAFQELFAGASERSHLVGDTDLVTNKHKASRFDYQNHLGGECGLGLTPVNGKGYCSFGAIDVDNEKADHSALAREVARRKLPLIVCRSRSGGAHLYLFLKDPLPAAPVRATLRGYAKALGLPESTEIFPKQDQLGDDPKEETYYGSAIRLPYFAGDRTLRYAVGADGAALSLAQFLASVERVTAARLDDVDLAPAPQPEPAPAKEAAKVRLTAEGPILVGPHGRPPAKIAKDYRNPTLFHHGIRLLNAGYPPEAVGALLKALNKQLCDPPLDDKEIEKTIEKTLLKRAATQPPLKVVAPLRFLNLTEFLAHQPKDDEPAMIAGLLPEGGWVTLVSRPKIGKSHTIQQIAFEAAMGKPVFGAFKVRAAVRAAYCDFEQSRAETLYRTRLMIAGYPDVAEAGDNYFTMTKDDTHAAHVFAYEISEPGNARRSEFADLLIEKKVNLLCLAALRSVVKLGGNLKDQEIAEAINEWVTWLQATANISIIVAHHSRKGFGGSTEQESFGSTMLSAAPDAMFILKREGTFNRFITTEVRFDAAPSFVLGLCPAGNGRLLRVIEDPDSVLTKRIMELHDKGLPTRAIASTPGINLSHNAVAERIRDGEAARKAKAEHEAVIHQEAVRREQELVLV